MPHGRAGDFRSIADDDDRIFGIEKRRALLGLALAAVLGFGALALLSQATSLGKAFDAVRRSNKAWFAGLLAGQLIAYGGYAAGYRTLARACGGPCFSYLTALRLSIASFGAYVLASSAGGLGVDFWALRTAGEGLHRAGRRVLAFNILEWAVLGLFATAAGAAALAGLDTSAPRQMALAWLVVTPAAVAAGLWVSQPARIHRFAKLPHDDLPDDLGWFTRDRLRWLAEKAKTGLADAIGALGFLRDLLVRPRRYAEAPLGFGVYWAGDLLTLYCGVRALGGSIGVIGLVLAYTTGYVVTSAPLPAGAAGFSEVTTAYSLHLVGIPLGTAIFAVFLYRVFTFWLPIAPALASLPTVRQLAEQLPDTPREDCPPCEIELD